MLGISGLHRVHQSLQQGNIPKASCALAAAARVQPATEVMEQLEQLHPAAPVPYVANSRVAPLQVSGGMGGDQESA
jgi:glycine cleavage system protein P-like pyridoxal-binding family